MRLLIVEDEERIASFLDKGLRAHGYEVELATSAGEALEIARDGIDLMVLDLGLPDLDGLEVIKRLRAEGVGVPILVLTARRDVADRVEGLEQGADDYLPKPFAFEELLARIRALVRSLERRLPTELRAAGVKMDLVAREVTRHGKKVELTAREFALLEAFLRAPGRVLSRSVLLADIWGIDFDPRSNPVDVYVGYLRRKLGADLIETVRQEGYRLRAVADAGS